MNSQSCFFKEIRPEGRLRKLFPCFTFPSFRSLPFLPITKDTFLHKKTLVRHFFTQMSVGSLPLLPATRTRSRTKHLLGDIFFRTDGGWVEKTSSIGFIWAWMGRQIQNSWNNHSVKTVTKHEISKLFYRKYPPRGAAGKDVSLPIAVSFRKSTNTTCYEIMHSLTHHNLVCKFFTLDYSGLHYIVWRKTTWLFIWRRYRLMKYK